MKEIADLFKRKSIKIGGLLFSLDEIEHGLLRQNKRQIFDGNPVMQKLMVDNLDYRIHFALNCGAQSCPPIAFYTSDQIDYQLAVAEASFVEKEFIVNHDLKTIRCSALFSWYREDFSERYLDDEQHEGYRVDLMPYEWRI